MDYNFDHILERRGTNSEKWDGCVEMFGRDDLLPMWVADSDWPAPPPVLDALEERIKHGAFGYTYPGRELTEIVVDWVQRHYQWKIEPEWVLYASGVVPAINVSLRALIEPGDEVVIQPPVYYPFYTSIKESGAQIISNQLVFDGDKYRLDYADLENCFRENSSHKRFPRIKAALFCSPHNPVGRVWEREELLRFAEICLKNQAVIISDEIHADLVYPGEKHIPLASLSEEIASQTITMIAPSKTFNIAGLHSSVVIIPDPGLRESFERNRAGLLSQGNAAGFTAMEAAYSKCDDWLEAQIDYLQGNRDYALGFISDYLPEIEVSVPEGTYLLWLDFRKLGMTPEELENFMVEKARVAMDPGTWFGSGGEGFMRMNLACPRALVEEGLERIARAIKELN